MEWIIDADALAELLKRQAELHKSDGLLERSYGVLDAYTYVLRATIGAVPVVRCKDCARCSIEVDNDYWCDGRKVWKDHYCSYGERRKG